jgi:uncharacterized protein (TIGR00645 family)
MPLETPIERGIFYSRWLLAPFYVGLIGALAGLLVTFTQELWHFLSHLMSMGANDAILAALALIDLSLAGNLLIIVIFSGYENFVSKIDVAEADDKLDWRGKVDFTGLKLKLIASIVAISGIHLLKVFMDIQKYSEDQIRWMIIIHTVFVISGVLLALMDYLVSCSKNKMSK